MMLAAAPDLNVRADDVADPTPDIEDVFREHADFVWRALRRQGLSAEDAEDGLQDVFVVVHRRLPEYEERGLMRAWLLSIALQIAAHQRRAHSRRLRKFAAVAESCSDESAHDPQRQLEAATLVRGFLAELEPAQADVFYFVELEEMTAPEVAVALGVNVNTVYSRLRLARKRFEAMVREHAGDLP